jgi:hypothetical protein
MAALRALANEVSDFASDAQLVRHVASAIIKFVSDFSDEVPCEEDPWDTRAAIYRALIEHIYSEESSHGLIYRIEGLQPPWTRSKWPWPMVNGTKSGRRSGELGGFEDFSALALFGYSVAKANADKWPDKRRQQFLSDFIEMELPSIVEQEFGTDYGKPMTTDRLRKVAWVIAGNCGLRYKNDPRRYAYAIEKWEADLNYLKEKFYNGAGLKFVPWPDPRS